MLNNCYIGFEFEFLTNFSHQQVKKMFVKEVGKKLYLTYHKKGFDGKSLSAHSEFNPTSEIFKLEYDHSGDKIQNGKLVKCLELITGPLEYREARIQVIKILDFIKKYGFTSQGTGIHVNVNFLDTKYKIQDVDRLKLCLAFEEDYIYKLFPNRKNNVYARSIKSIVPINPFIFSNTMGIISPEMFIVPNGKHFGINFLKQAKNYLEFRYLGGENYEKKVDKILKAVEYITETLHEILADQNYKKNEIKFLENILENHHKIVQSFSNYKRFLIHYPKIKLFVDLKSDEAVINSFYNENLRYKIYNLIVYGNMKSGLINYDSDVSKIQVKDTELKKCFRIEDIEIINSKVDGIFDHCIFDHCEIENSSLIDCEINEGNLIKNSKIKDSEIRYSNKLESCYIENKQDTISGVLNKCIIRWGLPNILASLTDCVILDKGDEVFSKDSKIKEKI